MQVLCHDFGAKRAFLLKAAGPAKLLIYFQDFRSFSNPGIRRFLTDLDLSSPLLHPHLFLSSTLSAQGPLLSLAPSLSYCWRLQFVNLNPFYANTFTHTNSDISFKYGTHTLSHACLGLCVESCGQTSMDFAIVESKSQNATYRPTRAHVPKRCAHLVKHNLCAHWETRL